MANSGLWSALKTLVLGRRRPVADDAGAQGERLAAGFLEKERGFRLVANNWRNPRDEREEIDLVCLDGAILVFVEVKARAADALVPGYFAVNPKKKKILRRACTAYLNGLRSRPHTYRFDIVEIGHGAPGGPRILHFENVPLFL